MPLMFLPMVFYACWLKSTLNHVQHRREIIVMLDEGADAPGASPVHLPMA